MDNIYMKAALAQANKAKDNGDIPVGAVVVKNNRIISRAYNKREKTKDVINHAEIIAIRKACKKLNDWRLNNCILYVTLEPCMMCLGAAVQARISNIIYATKSDNRISNSEEINISQIDNLNLEKESSKLLKDFFQNKRK